MLRRLTTLSKVWMLFTRSLLTKRHEILRIVDVIEKDRPDWLFIQFNQFSYGRWGLNPFLPLAIARIRRRCPGTRIAWMAHEDFVPITNWRFAVMTIWQRAQFKALGQMADHIFFSIEPWTEKYQAWFPRKPVTHLPVGSNIPHVGPSRDEARRPAGYSGSDAGSSACSVQSVDRDYLGTSQEQ